MFRREVGKQSIIGKEKKVLRRVGKANYHMKGKEGCLEDYGGSKV